MKKYLILFLTINALWLNTQSQVAINTDGTAADESAQLEIKSTTKGILIPRMTQAQRDAMVIPAESLLIFQTDNTPGFYYFDGIDWLMLSTSAAAGGSGWELTGNAGTDVANNFVGTSDNVDFVFRVNNTAKLKLKTNGTLETLNTGQSVFMGEGAGTNDDLTANRNTFIGYYAGNTSSSGHMNSAFGYRCLISNTSGQNNTALGKDALYTNANGNYNIAVGSSPLYSNTSGGANIAIGTNAMYYNTTGHNNIAIGYTALNYNTTGVYNIAMGDDALRHTNTGYGNTAIGYHSADLNTTGYRNVAIGREALFVNETGDYNTACGYASGPSPVSPDLNNTTSIGNAASVTASNTIHIGNTSITEIAGQVAFSTYSDMRFKNKVKQNVVGLEFIRKLNPVTYNWDIQKLDKFLGNNEEVLKDPTLKIARDKQEQITYGGFLAQEVEQAAKEANYNFSGVVIPENDKSLYSIRYAEFVVPLVKAVQELDKQNEILVQQVEKQNSTIEILLKKLELIEKSIKKQIKR